MTDVVQSSAISSHDARASGRTQSSLRTPVVPAKKRAYEFVDDMEDDDE
jgi:hypothetical protein